MTGSFRGVLVREWTEFQNLTLADVPRPALEPNQLRLSVRAAGVSFAMSLVVAGKYQRKPPRPFVPGTEVAGVVIEAGADATRFKPGDRVMAAADWGALGEECVVREVNAHLLPDAISFRRSVPILNSYGTSLAALTWPHLLAVKPGETLLVHGAAGGVGTSAVEIGKILGARVIATASSPEKRAFCMERGGDHVIDYTAGPFRDEVLALTGGRGADAVYDPVGGDVFDQSLRCIAPEGRICPVGFAGGRIPQIPANILLVKNITVCGLNFGYHLGWSPHDARYEFAPRLQAMMRQLFDWTLEGRIRPTVDDAFPLERFQEAMAMVLGRKSKGRVAIVMGPDRGGEAA